jgi:hypothetical protein
MSIDTGQFNMDEMAFIKSPVFLIVDIFQSFVDIHKNFVDNIE